jgi:hypothetical protein
MDEGLAKLAGEIDAIHKAGKKEAEEILKKGSGNIDLAVKWIATRVQG